MFLAFAILYPNYEVNLFFVLPVKVGWLGIAEAALLVLGFIQDTWAARFGLVMALINLVIFFGPRAITSGKDLIRRRQWRDHWK